MMSKNGKLRVLVVGSGGREHAIVKACIASPLVASVIAVPGNGGIAQQDVQCFDIRVDDIMGIVHLAQVQSIDFVIIGPELPLSMGLSDALEAVGIPAYGPNQKAAQLEASKAFAKAFLNRYNIPTAKGAVFHQKQKAVDYLKEKNRFPVVIKASGLAAGKGVFISETFSEAENTIHALLEAKCLGVSSEAILIEDFLQGEEASIMAFVCGEKYVLLPASQDHKRVGEGDTGPNTGGMGAYAPAAVVTSELEKEIINLILKPTLRGLIQEGIDFRGTLYVGIMITATGPKVLEFNVRLGDPECQILLPLLASDPISLFYDTALGRLEPQNIAIRDVSAVVVVHAAHGYPDHYRKGDVITFPNILPDGVSIIHAGTRRESGSIVSDGGRVLGVVAVDKDLKTAVKKVYEVSKKVHFEGSHYRSDIAHRELSRNRGIPQ